MAYDYESEPEKGKESDPTTKSYPGQGKKVGDHGCTGVNKEKAADQNTEERVTCDPSK